MSEPPRLRDDGPEDLRALLQAGAPTRSMSGAQRARTARRLARHASAAAVAAALSWAPGAALGAGLGVAAVLVVWVIPAWLSPAPALPARPAAPAVVTAPPAVTAPAAAPPPPSASAVAAPPAPRPSAATSAPVASAEPAPAGDALAEEVALLDRARAALGGNPAEALALTDGHAARYPAGKLGMEREMVAIDALRRLGRTGEARARGEAMLARAQGGLYEDRVRKLLEGMR
jgi:hypothetical protein